MKQVNLVAEIGCNHQGKFNQALKMLDILKNYCNIKYVKFQKRSPKELLNDKQYLSPHPVPANSFGKTYGEHREKLEFDLNAHKKLIQYCKKNNMIYGTSVWDKSSIKTMLNSTCEHLKIPSACNNNVDLLEYLFSKFKKTIHISLGMTTRKEENIILRFIKKYKVKKNKIIIYSCTSDYPVSDSDVCLLEIERIKKKFGNFAQIGFSGHHHGIAIDIAAATLGVDWIERHFTLDRSMKGTDHAASLEPDGMRRLQRDLISLSKALSFKKNEILKCEISQRNKLKFKK